MDAFRIDLSSQSHSDVFFGSSDFFLPFTLGFSIGLEDPLASILFTHTDFSSQGWNEEFHCRTFSYFYNRHASCAISCSHRVHAAPWRETRNFRWHPGSILWGQEHVCSTCYKLDPTLWGLVGRALPGWDKSASPWVHEGLSCHIMFICPQYVGFLPPPQALQKKGFPTYSRDHVKSLDADLILISFSMKLHRLGREAGKISDIKKQVRSERAAPLLSVAKQLTSL